MRQRLIRPLAAQLDVRVGQTPAAAQPVRRQGRQWRQRAGVRVVGAGHCGGLGCVAHRAELGCEGAGGHARRGWDQERVGPGAQAVPEADALGAHEWGLAVRAGSGAAAVGPAVGVSLLPLLQVLELLHHVVEDLVLEGRHQVRRTAEEGRQRHVRRVAVGAVRTVLTHHRLRRLVQHALERARGRGLQIQNELGRVASIAGRWGGRLSRLAARRKVVA
mmetsp:Transcript_38386/g.96156  ORF Transcript_38386/g.96156 Transcript_38386/m.96156 type:complete len:219 (-) Transcript_38386:343-999(-)